MPAPPGTVERRRELLAELERERARAVAPLPLEDDAEPPASSKLWPAGIVRLLAASGVREGEAYRETVRNVAVVALAWLEACDRL